MCTKHRVVAYLCQEIQRAGRESKQHFAIDKTSVQAQDLQLDDLPQFRSLPGMNDDRINAVEKPGSKAGTPPSAAIASRRTNSRSNRRR